MAQFDDTILPKDSPLITQYPFLVDRSEEDNADGLEPLVRSGISRWNNARVANLITGNTINNLPYLMRQFLTTTTANLTSSQSRSDTMHSGPITLPITFFLNTDVFSALGFPGPFVSVSIDRRRYQMMLEKYEVKLEDQFGFKQPGDTHFAFLIPEPTAEDLSLLKVLFKKKVITTRLAACIYMIDFCNPVYSKQREALLPYLPDSVTSSTKDFAAALEEAFVGRVSSSPQAAIKDTPEFMFMQNWNIVQQTNWVDTFNQSVMNYWTQATQRANTDDGFDKFFQLAESRRWQFKNTPLFEFPLTFATTNMPDGMFPIVMMPDGTVKKV